MPGLNRTHGPVRKRKKHTGRIYRESAGPSGIPRAVFEGLLCDNPGGQTPGQGRPTCYPPLVTHGRWAGSSQLGPPLRGRAFCALKRPPHPAPGLMTLETSLEGDGIM